MAFFILYGNTILEVSAADKYNKTGTKSQENSHKIDDDDDDDDSDEDDDSKDSKIDKVDKAGKASKGNTDNKVAGGSKDDKKTEDGNDDDDEPAEPGQLSGFINSEVEAAQDWLSDSEGDSQAGLSANMYGLVSLQLTSGLKLGTELSFETEGDGEYLALESPSLFLKTLNFSYSGELGGIGFGKVNHFNEDNLVDSIWERSVNLFTSFPSSDLDLSETIGVRAWLNLGHFLDIDHYLYGGVFFQDTTLNRSVFTQRAPSNTNDNNLSNTGKPNNWVISLHGDELPYLPDWEYSVGVVKQLPGIDDLNSELSVFSGIYGEFDLDNDMEISPFGEFVYRDGANGQNQSAASVLLSLSVDTKPWIFGISYSHRHLIDHDNDNEVTDDSDAQLFASYYFESGLSVDVGYQFLKQDSETAHAINLAVSIPFEFMTNLYGTDKAVAKGLTRNSMKRKIRR